MPESQSTPSASPSAAMGAAPAAMPNATAADYPGRASAAEAPPGEVAKESEIWTGRTHWKHFLPGLVLWVIGASVVTWLLLLAKGDGGGAWSWVIAFLWLGSGLFVLGRMVARILGHRYRLTTQRLFIERGILSQTIDQTELIRVDDVRMHKSVLDRIFGLGTVEIASSDATNPSVRIVGVAGPETVAEHVRANMRIMRKRAVFVENV
ncbi:MAG: PH domain-containing protein [Phycisphaerales bacterium]|nr:PH domain-containing protein [Phycisphaerales bacterium]